MELLRGLFLLGKGLVGLEFNFYKSAYRGISLFKFPIIDYPILGVNRKAGTLGSSCLAVKRL